MASYYSCSNGEHLGSAVAAAVIGIVSLATTGITKLVQYHRTLDAQRALAKSQAEIEAINQQIARIEAEVQTRTGKVYAEVARQEKIKLYTAGAVAVAGIAAVWLFFKK